MNKTVVRTLRLPIDCQCAEMLNEKVHWMAGSSKSNPPYVRV